MKNLSVLFPYVTVLFSDKGVSMSQAQRDKEKIKNENEKLLEKLSYKDSKIYNKQREIISENIVKESTVEGDLITVWDFNVLPDIAESNKLSAIYGNGIKTKNALQLAVSQLTNEKIAENFGIIIPTFQKARPQKEIVTLKPIDAYCSLEKIEELFEFAGSKLIEKIGKFYFNGLEIEAKAAAYGKQVTEKDCLIRKISKRERRGSVTTDKTNSMIVYETPVLGVDKDEFAQLEAEIMKNYETFQIERNSIMKQIKDIARETQRQCDVEYSNALTQYNQEYEIYSQKLEVAYSQCETIKTELLQEVTALKIRVM